MGWNFLVIGIGFGAVKLEIQITHDSTRCEQPGDMCLFALISRCFNSAALGLTACPIRQKAWVSKCDSFDYRSTQDEGAVVPRDGKWFPSHDGDLCGNLGAIEPGDFESQGGTGYIDVDIRSPWAPSRLNVAFKSGNVWNKVSFRPDRRRAAVWKPPTYSRAVSEQDARAAFPSMFYIHSEFTGNVTDPKTATDPKPRSTRRTSPSRPARATTIGTTAIGPPGNTTVAINIRTKTGKCDTGYKTQNKKWPIALSGIGGLPSNAIGQERRKKKKKKRPTNHNRHLASCQSPILLLPLLLLLSLPSLNPLDPIERQPGLFPFLTLVSSQVRAFRRSLPKSLL